MNKKTQTRGRPKKKSDQKLPQQSRKLFSQHCAVFYACCMVYVLQTFLKTKHEKRIGHSQGGFTIYQRLNDTYSFQHIEKDCQQWGLNSLLQRPNLMEFIKVINGCAPKFVLFQILLLIEETLGFLDAYQIQSIQSFEQNQYKLLAFGQNNINQKYKYLRFTIPALKQLKMEKWSSEVSKKINQLWKPFLTVVSYSIFCIVKNIKKNKYLKPFFSDAENPEETIIGQLNLRQIVKESNQELELERPNLLGNSTIFQGLDKGSAKGGFQRVNQFTERKKSPTENCNSDKKFNQSPDNRRELGLSSVNVRSNSLLRPIRLICQPSQQFSSEQKTFRHFEQDYNMCGHQKSKVSVIYNLMCTSESKISIQQSISQQLQGLQIQSLTNKRQGFDNQQMGREIGKQTGKIGRQIQMGKQMLGQQIFIPLNLEKQFQTVKRSAPSSSFEDVLPAAKVQSSKKKIKRTME